jgi:hypothetical protein
VSQGLIKPSCCDSLWPTPTMEAPLWVMLDIKHEAPIWSFWPPNRQPSPTFLIAWCSRIECFKSTDHWVSARTIAVSYPARTHHVDTMSFGNRIPVDDAPNLKVVFDNVPIGGRSWWCGARCPRWGLKDGHPDWISLWCHGSKNVWPCIRIQSWADIIWCWSCRGSRTGSAIRSLTIDGRPLARWQTPNF